MSDTRESLPLACGRQPDAARANGLALAVLLACQAMLVIDGTVVYAALPALRADLGLARADLSWVQNAYMLTFGGFILLGARVGDLLGHRRIFVAASAAFVLASITGGIAQSVQGLLIARAAQGIAGAFAAPSALALLMLLFPAGAARVRAIGLYTAVSGGGSAVGLVLGGALTDLASWRSVLFINVPIGVVLLAFAPRCLPGAPRNHGRFDVMGASTVTLGMSLLVYALIRCVHDGAGDPGVVASFVAAGLSLAAFVFIEGRVAQPITPLSLFADLQRSGALAGRMLLIGGMLGTFFFLTQYVQGALGFSALRAGLAFLPLSVTQCLMVIYGVPRLMPRLGAKGLLTGGLSIAAIGTIALGKITANAGFFADLAWPVFLLGLGTGAALVPLTTAGIAGVGAGQAGAASGLVNATHYLGGATGTALIVLIVESALNRSAGVREFGGPASGSHTKAELAQALSVAATTSAAFLGLALVIVLVTMRRHGAQPPA
nr:putative MFS-type transporter EfpA [Paraburkholderia busanensis]